MAIRVRISGTRPLRSAGASSLAGRGWTSPMPGDLVEVRLQDGSWVAGTVSFSGYYPSGTSLRISINGAPPTYFVRCHVRLVQGPPMQMSVVSSTETAKRRRRRRCQARREARETSPEYFGGAHPHFDVESAESSNECYL